MAHPIVAQINGHALPAVPRGCRPFPAASYPPEWTLHVATVSPDEGYHVQTAPGDQVNFLNDYAAAAHAGGVTVFAWIIDSVG